ncbi:putative secreted protein (Por secretion system target) [Salegentibacter sp. 24]|uniref:T9SS type A sorting domain-containing protein n=1 Tax=Salegentibacter sp. 24 TaxID=2183986 RepID=UPI0010620336|nr:T9SS type A sorting domain-containing protein [Salegentibacter sp. 24]TDN95246.1 putative secreted protein (Por secretion system target) [Salegentibacter sp. 24]
MKQYYFYTFILAVFLSFTAPNAANAQEKTSSGNRTEIPIEGLSIYPNPVTNGKVYISTSQNKEKDILIYNVLGKPVHRTKIRGKELDVSNLSPGIYILKIKEERATATRKLVVR